MIEAVLFDFNGVIADDEEQHREALGAVLAEAGLSLTREQYYSDFLGFDDRSCLIEAFLRAGKPLPSLGLEHLLDEKSRVYQRLIDRPLAPRGCAALCSPPVIRLPRSRGPAPT